jgi:hypothetical protein
MIAISFLAYGALFVIFDPGGVYFKAKNVELPFLNEKN